MARPSPSCAHDDDRLCLPPASPSRSNSAEKKESTDPRLSQLCPPYVTPSSSSSLEHHLSYARIVENGFAASSGVSNSAKVGLDQCAGWHAVACSTTAYLSRTCAACVVARYSFADTSRTSPASRNKACLLSSPGIFSIPF